MIISKKHWMLFSALLIFATVWLTSCSKETTRVSVTFDSQGGSPVASVSFIAGQALDSLPTSMKTGYAFAGWYTDVNGAGTQYQAADVKSNLHLYAYWILPGTKWTPCVLPIGADWHSVTYGNGIFVTIASQNSCYSVDGTNWTMSSIPINFSGWLGWSSVSFVNGSFIALGSSASVAARSSDGIHWTVVNLPFAAQWSSVMYGNGVYLAAPSYGNSYALSTDGISWSAQNFSTNNNVFTTVVFGNGEFLAFTINHDIATSIDGKTWSFQSGAPSIMYSQTIVYANGSFVGISSFVNSVTSTNGVAWVTQSIPQGAPWYSLAYGNNSFVAIPSGNRIVAVTYDLNTWKIHQLPSDLFWSSITYGKGKFVAVANGTNLAATSP